MKALVTAVLLIALATSCRSPEAVTDQQAATEAEWTPDDFRPHLAALNTSQGSGRRSGSVHHATALNYVISQHRAVGLLPGMSEFSIPFISDRNLVDAFDFRARRADSLRVLPGIDVAPAAFSGSGDREISQISTGFPPSPTVLSSTAVVFESDAMTDRVRREIQRRKIPTVFSVGPLDYRSSTSVIDSTVVVQMTSQALGRLMQISSSGVRSILDGASGRVFRLPDEVRASVASRFEAGIRESNIVGIVPGSAPSYSGEVILIVSVLETGGEMAGLPTYSFYDLGAGSAVMIEVANRMAARTEYSTLPFRSVMFAHLHSGDDRYSGIRAFFDNPVWSKSAVIRMILVGVDSDNETIIRSYTDDLGIEVTTVRPALPADLDISGFLVRSRWAQAAEERSQPANAIDRRLLSVAVDSAAVQAASMSKTVMEIAWKLATEVSL